MSVRRNPPNVVRTLSRWARITLGEIRLHQGQLREAEALIQQSLKLAQSNEDQILEAYAWRALGEVYQAGGDGEAQQYAFAQVATIFRRQNLLAELEQIPTIPPLDV